MYKPSAWLIMVWLCAQCDKWRHPGSGKEKYHGDSLRWAAKKIRMCHFGGKIRRDARVSVSSDDSYISKNSTFMA